MRKRQTIAKRVPRRVLLSDARNDAGLERALARLGTGDALVFRHYHLSGRERRQRFERLARLARLRGVAVIGARLPSGWRVDGSYGSAREVSGQGGVRLATAHSLQEIGAAVRARADAILLWPALRSTLHPGGIVLGPLRRLLLARQSPLPVIALGGMTRARARQLPIHGWAAIDGLS